ncbi:MAG: hypothetical protein J07AB43_02910 [Candidatus Nanosalina sp. J07AB43]|jgi:hypothetical protein|nr:MAG: hypothetical protein J07AB43_02910 [Candidatus Nanosalina sp. J07AB43]
MTLSRRFVDKVAICSSRLSSNNYFSVSAKDVEATDIEAGDQVRVVLIRTDLDGDIKPRDRAVYQNTLQKSNQIYVPKDARDKLDLQDGDIIKYIVIPKKAFPGVMDGPLRERFGDILEGSVGSDDETESQEQTRPSRDTTSAEFSASMQKTGQITVPKSVREDMGLIQGDTVLATIKWQGDDISANKDIGSGNRIIITKDQRDELGLEPGDEPTIRLAVFG